MSLNIGVIGAGKMGTGISQSIVDNVDSLLLYARNKEICDEINETGFNSRYFPNLKLNKKIVAVNDLNDLKNTDIIFLCIPSSNMRQMMIDLKNINLTNCIFVNTAKGIESSSNKRMSEVINEIIGKPPVVLSGPNIASEMAMNLLTATTIAGEDLNDLNLVEKALSSQNFIVNSNTDVIGTEFCGIIKNVVAISQGICEGMNINDNARFALFTRSFAEVKQIIEFLGGKKETVDDYCGYGDIITASTLPVSRNHTLGVLYGQGIVVDEKKSGILFEGKNTVLILKKLCDDHGADISTVNFVYDVIINGNNPKESFNIFWNNL